jgi:hypothetical protein
MHIIGEKMFTSNDFSKEIEEAMEKNIIKNASIKKDKTNDLIKKAQLIFKKAGYEKISKELLNVMETK